MGCTWGLALKSLCLPGLSRAFSAHVSCLWQFDTSWVFSGNILCTLGILIKGDCGSAAFGFTQDQFADLPIAQLQFQHFTDAHTTSGHQFEDQSITNLGGAEDDFVDGFLFDDFPPQKAPFPDRVCGSWAYRMFYEVRDQYCCGQN